MKEKNFGRHEFAFAGQRCVPSLWEFLLRWERFWWYFSAVSLAYRGQLSVEDIVAFVLYLSLFYAPVSGLANLLENLQQSGRAERVTLILIRLRQYWDAEDAVELKDVKGSIAFEHVSFHYGNKIPVLKDISFSCKPGMMVALVGLPVGKDDNDSAAVPVL